MKIKVTQEHINKGIPRNHSKCPVALACREACKCKVHVLSGRVYVYSDCMEVSGKTQLVQLPYEAKLFIDNFDKGRESCKPFEFDLED